MTSHHSADKQLYLQYSYYKEIWAGLGHHFSNLVILLAEAAVTGRTFVIPDLTLDGKHNNGKPLIVFPLKYFDLSGCTSVVSFILLNAFQDDRFAIAS